ncbi:flavin-containing monooxygenase [uncultured Sphingomonas sp.]|uniref:flavin-containing monooxygenase n=1 Tax=uncultured Sphingomonas sp. TaxID=158754 RepID=UPI0035CC3D89
MAVDLTAVVLDQGESPVSLEFDPDMLRRRYREERDKRLRADGNKQYVELTGEFAAFLEDPYVERLERGALEEENDVVIIGGGFGGLLAAARLREAGYDDIRVIERGGDFGGTWYWNRYPGAACDVESYIYLPLLEETGFMPRKKYTPAAEILEHCRRIATQFGLYDRALLQTDVAEARWDEGRGRWRVSTNRGDVIWASFVVVANGPANKPKLPGIPGVESFKGHMFHTSRWDYDYTGGGPEGGLDGLAGKRVGIIGTGATGVQCIPHVGASAKHLYVFQRTPSSIDVRNDRPTDRGWARGLAPGWQKERRENFNAITSGEAVDRDLVNDGWTEIIASLLRSTLRGGAGELDAGAASTLDAQRIEIADFAKMEQLRRRIQSTVEDPKTAELLKPYYRQFCKRPCFHDGYLKTFNRDNVTLVDTDGRGVERITERGVVVGGVEYEVDCLIFASGFEIGTTFRRRTGYEIIGKDGLTLSEKWGGGMSTMHGIFVHGFPNLFFLMFVQAALPANFTHLLDEQATQVAYVLRTAQERGAERVEVTAEGEAEWVRTIIELSRLNADFLESCTPGIFNLEGQINTDLARRGAGYGKGAAAYFRVLADWRASGELPGLALTASREPAN